MRKDRANIGLIAWGLALVAATPAIGAPAQGCAVGTIRFGHVRDLPRGALAAVGFALADRGEPFQATDAILPGPRLPGRRFVSARQQGCTLTLHYETGGIAHTDDRAVLQSAHGQWHVVSRTR